MVIPPHRGAAREGEWDGPLMRTRVRSPESAEYFARIFAYRDDGKDESMKSSYRFIHHFVDQNGDPGDASVQACVTGIAVLNGARGGSVLRGDDRRGVYDHLANHLEQADIEPPELRSLDEVSELRRHVWGHSIEVRRGLDVRLVTTGTRSDQVVLRGYAAVYNQPSSDFGGWTEIIAPQAFATSAMDHDVKALWNHNSDFVLGSVSAGTLRLASDETGLRCEIVMPRGSLYDSFAESVRRGDVSQMSIGFVVHEDRWDVRGGAAVRTILDAELWEVSPVAFPAYSGTQVTAGAESPDSGDSASRSRRLSYWQRRLHIEEILGGDACMIRRLK